VTSTETRVGRDTWWPSKYGPDDEAGALNEITPAKVLEAIGLVRRGVVFDLAHVLHADIPAFPGRTFRQYLTTNYHHINRRRSDAGPAGWGRNSVNWIVEQVTATQQMGTHMDGLNHLQMGDRTYNGFLLADIIEDHGAFVDKYIGDAIVAIFGSVASMLRTPQRVLIKIPASA
jgi:hypothetical protein